MQFSVWRLCLAIISRLFAMLLAVVCVSWLVTACTTSIAKLPRIAPVDFSEYQQHAFSRVLDRREFQTLDRQSELVWNAPAEWRPGAFDKGTRPQRGILLVHGLGDSPWSFHDLAPALAEKGYLVRTVLLPGHGTRPADLLDVDVDDWRMSVHEQAAGLKQDVDGDVYLGGFSTGANLVLEVAYAEPSVAGLLLFSPGFRSDLAPLDGMAPLIARVRPWFMEPGEGVPSQNAVRYINTPLNGFAQYYYSSRIAQRLLGSRPYDKPVFLAVAEHDSVLDTGFLRETFSRRFSHPASRMIWYGNSGSLDGTDPRVLHREDHLPEWRISQFSHMGLLFAPDNPLYGQTGSLRLCLNSMDGEATRTCEKSDAVWYSAWGYHEEGKAHARLTFNPYFDWQISVVEQVLQAGKTNPGNSNIALNDDR